MFFFQVLPLLVASTAYSQAKVSKNVKSDTYFNFLSAFHAKDWNIKPSHWTKCGVTKNANRSEVSVFSNVKYDSRQYGACHEKSHALGPLLDAYWLDFRWATFSSLSLLTFWYIFFPFFLETFATSLVFFLRPYDVTIW